MDGDMAANMAMSFGAGAVVLGVVAAMMKKEFEPAVTWSLGLFMTIWVSWGLETIAIIKLLGIQR
jgi:hypothetical protein